MLEGAEASDILISYIDFLSVQKFEGHQTRASYRYVP